MKHLKNADFVSEMTPARNNRLARIEQIKRRALGDLFYFAKYVLGYNLMEESVHTKMSRLLSRRLERGSTEQSTKMILMPRGSFKSSVGTIAYTLWRLAKDPNLTILITNEKLDKSKAFLKAVKAHVSDNKRFKLLFGEWSCENKMGKKWSETRIDIMPRNVWGAAPSVEASSVESSETGKHVDIIICDDLHGQSNTGTKEQIDKVIEYWRDLGAVLKPGGEMIVIGTRWDYKDLYQFLYDLKAELGELSNIEILHEKAERPDGSLFFPQVLSPAFLARQRVALGSYFYNAQYQNDPVEKENALVKKVLKYGSVIEDKPALDFFRDCYHFITVDLAFTEDKRSDSTAFIANAVNPHDGVWYIRRYDILRTGDPDRIIELMFEYDSQFKPVRYGIEANNYKSWLKKSLEDAMRERGSFLPIDPPDGLSHYGPTGGKGQRLRKLGPRFNMGHCFIGPEMSELEDELLKLTYDGARGHDDLLDALAMQEEIVFWGVSQTANKYDNEEPKSPEARLLRRWPVTEDVEKEWLYA